MEKKKYRIPKEILEKDMPTMTMEDALKDVVPWVPEVENQTKDFIIISKENLKIKRKNHSIK